MISRKQAIIFLWSLLLTAGISAQPKSAVKLVEKAKEHMRAGTLVQATVLLTKAIAKDKKYAEAYELRAMSFQGMERIEQAKEDYEKAVELDPHRIVSLVRLMSLFKKEKDWRNVIKYASLIKDNSPDNLCPSVFELAQAYDKLEKTKEAFHMYKLFLDKACEGIEDQVEIAQKRLEELK